MAEVGCLKDGHFQNLQVENTTIFDTANMTLGDGSGVITISGGVTSGFPALTSTIGHGSTQDTTFNTGVGGNEAVVTRHLDWQLGTLKQTTHSINLNDIINAAGVDNDIVGFVDGAAAEFLKIPDGVRILSLTINLVEVSSAAADTFSLVGHTASVNEDATIGAGGTELLSGLNCSAGQTAGVLNGTLVGTTPLVSTLDFLFLANDGTNTNSSTERTTGIIAFTIVSIDSAGTAGAPLIAVGLT